jgi:hypothetical protein
MYEPPKASELDELEEELKNLDMEKLQAKKPKVAQTMKLRF